VESTYEPIFEIDPYQCPLFLLKMGVDCFQGNEVQPLVVREPEPFHHIVPFLYNLYFLL